MRHFIRLLVIIVCSEGLAVAGSWTQPPPGDIPWNLAACLKYEWPSYEDAVQYYRSLYDEGLSLVRKGGPATATLECAFGALYQIAPSVMPGIVEQGFNEFQDKYVFRDDIAGILLASKNPKYLPIILHYLDMDRYPNIAQRIAYGFDKWSAKDAAPAIPVLKRLLVEPIPPKSTYDQRAGREGAIHSLAAMGADGVQEAALRALDDPSWSMRTATLEAIIEFPSHFPSPAIREKMKRVANTATDPDQRIQTHERKLAQQAIEKLEDAKNARSGLRGWFEGCIPSRD